ncbi:COG4223 family protein [Actibacterium pelagium]|uniref:COG4223 family protein n=1 Tax=Actibacterium pelagium TaxID=2029103 RepID=UPI00117867F7|nr:mitofilin family membrane protein [Actibacterium pelagium]
MASSKKPDEIEEIDPKEPSEQLDETLESQGAEVSETKVEDAEEVTEVSEDLEADADDPVSEEIDDEAPAEDDLAEASEDEQPTPDPVEPIVAAPAPEKSGNGFLPTLLGGVLAAGLGFGVSQFLFTDATPPEADTSELEAALDKQSRDLAALSKAIEALAATPAAEAPDLSGPLEELNSSLSDAIAAVGTDVSDLSAQMAALETRLTEVEKRPAVASDTSGAVAAYERELNAIREELAVQQAKNDEMSAEVGAAAEAAKAEIDAASARARAIEAQAAVQTVQSALDTGTSYAASLASLPGDIPEALTASAETGVATLPELKASFDEYARQALSASLENAPGTSTQDRVGSFLRSQLNIRSLSPREGDDPDAVLSRAQGAVATGDLAAALSEIAALPESGQAAMADWTALAQARLAAKEAIETLAQALTAK